MTDPTALPEPAEPLLRMSLHQAAQWNSAVECAEHAPHEDVVLEGRTVLALERAIKAALLTLPRPAGAEVVLPEPDLRSAAHEMEVAIRFAECGLVPCAEEVAEWKVALADLRRAAVHLDREQRMGGALSDEQVGWWALVMGAAACIEDAANCLRDPDAKKAADGAAKHYREAAQKLLSRALLAAQSSEPANPAQESQHGSL